MQSYKEFEKFIVIAINYLINYKVNDQFLFESAAFAINFYEFSCYRNGDLALRVIRKGDLENMKHFFANNYC